MFLISPIKLAAFGAGLTAGLRVTSRLHNDPDAGIWGQRLGPTRLRYANLPVGGTLAFVISRHAPGPARGVIRSLGMGMFVGAVGFGLADPLPAA